MKIKEDARQERNYGIDALRIVSMFMILVLHILGSGGLLSAARPGTLRYVVFWLLEVAAFSAVDCYALISGYVGVKARYKYSNFIVLWLRVVFFTVLITLCFSIFAPSRVNFWVWMRAIFPVFLQQYWYVTAYALLFLFMPILNVAIKHLKQKQLKAVIILLIVMTMIVPTVLQADIFRLDNGYTGWWLIILYIVGGYFGKYEGVLNALANKRSVIAYGALVLVVLVIKLFFEWIGQKSIATYSILYTSPLIVAMAVCLLKYFSELHVSRGAKKFINFFAPLAFSVYLIHAYIIHISPSIWNFTWILQCPTVIMPFIIIGLALIIFVLLSLVDFVRERVFLKLRIKQRLNDYELKLGHKFEG